LAIAIGDCSGAGHAPALAARVGEKRHGDRNRAFALVELGLTLGGVATALDLEEGLEPPASDIGEDGDAGE
jgi:hypothetical protein